jgi:hypothetical protein
VHEDPESVDDPGSQALQRDIDGYLLDLARLYTMEMTIEYLAPRFQGQLKALQGTLPVGEAHRDLTELMRRTTTSDAAGIRTSSGNCCNSSSTCLTAMASSRGSRPSSGWARSSISR